MPRIAKFKVIKHRYENGTVAYRVTGRLHGEQIRKNYKTRKEAVAEKQRLEVDRKNAVGRGREIWTTLSPEENRDAVAAYNSLKQAGVDKTLSFAVDFMLKHYRETVGEVSLKDATQHYIKSKEQDEARGLISGRQLKSIRVELNALQDHFAERMADDITAGDLDAYLNTPKKSGRGRRVNGFSMKTWNNRRGLLGTFFRFAYKKKWIGRNPVEDVQQFKVRHRRGTSETLTAEQAGKLMEFLEGYAGPEKNQKVRRHTYEPGFLVPYFALALFAGVRPDWKDGEITKIRPKNIDLDVGVIRIEPEISKVNERRIVKIQPNLRAWLEQYPLPEAGAVPRGNPDRVLMDVRKQWALGHDVLRHTFISMLVGAFKSVGDAALQAGNSEAVIRRHYLDLKSETEADQFWRIMPKGMKLPEKMDKKDGVFSVVATK